MAVALASASVGSTALTHPRAALIWNASASAPIGFYAVAPADDLHVADLVVAQPPPAVAAFLDARGYLPIGVPLLKRILALPGQTVCRFGLDIVAYGAVVGQAQQRDRAGRLMPVWRGCRRIADGDAFLMNWDVPDSIDSRYFGPLPLSSIVGRALPVWTDEAGDGRFVWRAVTR
jgi:conjugative transfer signal peptidase TraF